jgi:hypothetical protein
MTQDPDKRGTCRPNEPEDCLRRHRARRLSRRDGLADAERGEVYAGVFRLVDDAAEPLRDEFGDGVVRVGDVNRRLFEPFGERGRGGLAPRWREGGDSFESGGGGRRKVGQCGEVGHRVERL